MRKKKTLLVIILCLFLTLSAFQSTFIALANSDELVEVADQTTITEDNNNLDENVINEEILLEANDDNSPAELPLESEENAAELEKPVVEENPEAPKLEGVPEENPANKLNENIQPMAEPKQIYPKITNVDFKRENGESPDTFSHWEKFRIEIDWDASEYGNDLREGDYFEISLPNTLKVTQSASTFDVMTPDGSTVIAQAVVTTGANGAAESIRITFNDYVNNKDGVKGNFFIASEFLWKQLNLGEENNFLFEVSSEYKFTETVIVKGPSEVGDEVLIKWPEIREADRVDWVVRLNYNKSVAGSVTVTDTLDPSDNSNIYFIENSFNYQIVEMDEYGNPEEIIEEGPIQNITFNENKTSFSFPLGPLQNRIYLVRYHSTYVPGITLKNNVTVTGDGVNESHSSSHHSASSGGTGDGDLLQKIQIIKVDKDNNEMKLPGAVFTVTPKEGGDSVTITTNNEGIAITPNKLTPGKYELKEITAPDGYLLLTDVIEVDITTEEVTIVTLENEKIPEPEKVNITGVKTWDGGPTPRPTIQLQLYRNNVAFGDPVDLADGTTTYTWNGLDKLDADGNEYEYTVDEVNVPDGYEKIPSTNALTVTNKFKIEKIEIKGTKVWDGGSTPRPAIQLQLYRNGVAFGTPVTLNDGTTSYTWTDLDKTDNNGNEYIYTVDEVNVPSGYEKLASDDGLTVINKFIPPSEPDKTRVTGVKTWIGGTTPRPAIQLQLYRNGIAFGTPVTLNDGTTSYTWTDLDRLDANGSPYVYTVDEVNVPSGYEKLASTNGLTVINRAIPPSEPDKTRVTGVKTWIGGTTPRPAIQLQLYRNGIAFGTPVTLYDGTTSYTWTALDRLDANGRPYVYTVDEINVPANYVKSNSTDGLTVINKYIPPVIPPDEPDTTIVTGVKTWIGGTTPRPTIELQLYRNGIAYGTPIILTDGNTSFTWRNLDKYDIRGNAYVYTVDEVNVPSGYVKSVDGLNVINRYVPPTTPPGEPPTTPPVTSPRVDITGVKTWVGGNSPRPTIEIQLYRNGVAFGTPVILEDGNTSYTWKDLDKFDPNGVEYVYTVDEINVPSGYVKSAVGLTVTNRYTPPIELRDITAKKVWVDGPQSKPATWFKLYRQIQGGQLEAVPNAEIKELRGITEVTWKDIETTDANGNSYYFLVKEVNSNGEDFVPEGYQKSEEGLTVINKYKEIPIYTDKPIPRTGATSTVSFFNGILILATIGYAIKMIIDSKKVRNRR